MKMNGFSDDKRRLAAVAVLTAAGYMVCTSLAGLAQEPSTRPRGGAQAGASQSAPDAEHGGAEAPTQGAGQRVGLVAYPDRPKAPQDVLDRGKAEYSVNCAFCHGSDAAGGSVGPNLLRSEIVLQDNDGELIGPIVHGARADRGMPKIDITDAQVKDVAAWLHSLKVSSRSLVKEKINIVVGDAAAGQNAFSQRCGSCHQVNGDLAGFAAKYSDPRAMQQAWIMPAVPGARAAGGGQGAAVTLKVAPVTATVTPASGAPVTGTLDTVDDFYVEVTTPDGTVHHYMRWNGAPKVEIHDPLEPHREMLRTISDKDIHDITAYLLSQK